MGTAVIGIALVGAFIAIVRYLKKEKGCSCGGDCSSCTHCNHS